MAGSFRCGANGLPGTRDIVRVQTGSETQDIAHQSPGWAAGAFAAAQAVRNRVSEAR